MTLRPVSNPSPWHGVIDLGTHSCLLLVGRCDERGELEVALDLCEIPRLGEGLAKTGALSEAGMDRTLDVLEHFQKRATELEVASLFIGGTAAMRRAANADVMIERVQAELGLQLTVIGEKEEAELAWLAATAGLGDNPEGICVVDVGGGSTEVVSEGGRKVRSFPLGGLVLTEAFGTGGREGEAGDWQGLEKAVTEGFQGLGSACETTVDAKDTGLIPLEPRASAGALLVALGGTACNYGALSLGLTKFDHQAPEGIRFPGVQAWKWARELAALPLESRLQEPIEEGRAPVLPAGLACLGEVARRLGATSLLVTGRGLRYGFLLKRLL